MCGKALQQGLHKWYARWPFSTPPLTPCLPHSFSDYLFFVLSASECPLLNPFIFFLPSSICLLHLRAELSVLSSALLVTEFTCWPAITPAHGLECWWPLRWGETLGKPFSTPILPCLGPFPVPFAFVHGSCFTCSAQSMPLTLIVPTHLFLAPHLVVCCFETQFRNYPFMFHLLVLSKFPSTVSKMSLFLTHL